MQYVLFRHHLEVKKYIPRFLKQLPVTPYCCDPGSCARTRAITPYIWPEGPKKYLNCMPVLLCEHYNKLKNVEPPDY